MSEVNSSLPLAVMDWRQGLRMARAHCLRQARRWRRMAIRFDWSTWYAGEHHGEQKAQSKVFRLMHRAKTARELARDLRALERGA